MTELYIFHLDDEPNYVNWIPSVVFNQVKEMLDTKATYSDDEGNGVDVTHVKFEWNELGRVELFYELHEDKDHFLERVKGVDPQSVVLYIFDLKLLGDGDAGAEVAKIILENPEVARDGGEAVKVEWFYLTGFPEAADAALSALDLGGKVVAKPPNSVDLAADILEILKVKLTPS